MIQIRKNVFETNSSSTHSLQIMKNPIKDYNLLASSIKISWIDTDDEYVLQTFSEKLSYLISQIANKLSWSCNTYEELLEELKDNYEYKEIAAYVKQKFNKEIRFPDNKNGIYDDVEEIVGINHQLVPYNTFAIADEVLDDLIGYMQNEDERDYIFGREKAENMTFESKLDIYFQNNKMVVFGRD